MSSKSTDRVLSLRQAEFRPVNLAPDGPPRLGVLGGDCLCDRGETIGTCVVTASRLWFRAFHEPPAAYHLERVTDWVCIDCLAEAAVEVANGTIREQMQRDTDNHAKQHPPEENPV